MLFGSAHFEELLTLDGDSGGRQLLGRYAEHVVEVELPSGAPLEDVDTPGDLLRLERAGGQNWSGSLPGTTDDG